MTNANECDTQYKYNENINTNIMRNANECDTQYKSLGQLAGGGGGH